MKISILCDNPHSWIVPYAEELQTELKARGHDVSIFEKAEEIQEGDCAFFLGCEGIVGKDIRARNAHNIVIHESALPVGRGWSPLTWQILEGKNDIPITLIEAEERIDSGDIYLQETIHFDGHELIVEMREKQGEATIALAIKFIETMPTIKGVAQKGEPTFYEKRSTESSELDPEKTIAEQFDLLRIVDNDRYPAFFKHRGHTYVLKIEKKYE